MLLMPGRGDGTFGAALGPATTSSRCAGSPAPTWSAGRADLLGVAGKQLVVVANRDTFELGAPIATGVSLPGWTPSSTPATGTATASATWSPATARASCGSSPATAPARSPPAVIGQGFGTGQGLRAVGDMTGDGLPDLMGPGRRRDDGLARQRLRLRRGRRRQGRRGPVPGRAAVGPLRRRLGGRGQALTLKGSADYIVRDRGERGGVRLLRPQAGVSHPRVLGEGLGAYDLAG